MNEDSVSIVIPAYNAAGTLALTVRACRHQDYGGPVEILVVDDGSTDRTRQVAEEGGARVLSQENRGPSAARNRGWREAASETLLFTDSDCVPRPDWVRRMMRAMGEGYDVVAGSYGIANRGSVLAETVHAEIRWRHSRFGEEVEYAGSFNLGVRRVALREVGGFDEAFPAPSGEDNDLSYRLRKKGFRIRFVREALVDHHHPTSLMRYLREQARHGLWRVVLYTTHPERMKGDGYAGPFELSLPPVAVVSLFGALGAPWSAGLSAIAIAGFCFLFLAHAVLAVRVAWHARSSTPLSLAGIGTLRAYARGLGMLRGTLRVLVTGRGRR